MEKEKIAQIAKQDLLDIEQGKLLRYDPVSHCKVIEEMLIAEEKRVYQEVLAKHGINLNAEKQEGED